MNQPTGFRRLNPGRSSLPWRRKGAPARYLSRQRLQEVLVLQGSPLLGAALALHHEAAEQRGPLAILMVAQRFTQTGLLHGKVGRPVPGWRTPSERDAIRSAIIASYERVLV
jgi:hypothetical protein